MISRETLVFILGLFVLILPYAGVPADWKRIAYTVCGVLLVVIGYSLRRSAFFRSFDHHRTTATPPAFEKTNDNHGAV